LMWKLSEFSLYSSVSRGFSPPSTNELLPTGGSINLDLNAENGLNYDAGIKGRFNDLTYDINGFIFHLDNTIVQRRTAGGGDYFINAGKTDQKGVEASANYRLFKSSQFVENSLAWLSYTFHHFKYRDFKQLTNDFSGKQLPGVARHTIAGGYDISILKGITGNITYLFSDRMPLNDANSAYADAYHLLGIKAGYRKRFHEKYVLNLFAGAENILNETYSLGNDINGFGGRYFNAAPGRNYYAGIIFELKRK
jgi:iron complex outermembrane receptor protein